MNDEKPRKGNKKNRNMQTNAHFIIYQQKLFPLFEHIKDGKNDRLNQATHATNLHQPA